MGDEEKMSGQANTSKGKGEDLRQASGSDNLRSSSYSSVKADWWTAVQSLAFKNITSKESFTTRWGGIHL